MSTATPPMASTRVSRSLGKHTLWYAFGIAGIVALIFTDLPLLLHPEDPYRAKLIADRFLILPHAFAGILATVLGPFQFSTRFRQRHLDLHRLMGKVYVVSIFVAAPSAFFLAFRGFTFPMELIGVVQPILWLGCTLAAFLTARNRHIAVHRQWMVRSYAFTLNFIFSRLPNFIPAYLHMSETNLALTLFVLTACYFFIPDLYFNWRELTQRRS